MNVLILSVNTREGRERQIVGQGSLRYLESNPSWIEKELSTCLVFPTLCPIALPGLLFNNSHTEQEQPACQQREPWPEFPFLSMVRHCCCEDKMSVLLKVRLKHNSDTCCWDRLFLMHWWRKWSKEGAVEWPLWRDPNLYHKSTSEIYFQKMQQLHDIKPIWTNHFTPEEKKVRHKLFSGKKETTEKHYIRQQTYSTINRTGMWPFLENGIEN